MVGDRSGLDKPPPPLRVVELFCGVGGCAAALEGSARVVAAYDQNLAALEVYRHNFGHPTHPRNLETVPEEELAALKADLWWLSPPCQPYTRRGLGRDLEDPRAGSLRILIERIAQVRPPRLALENVPGFATSRARARLVESLLGAGYEVRERRLCPSDLGLPNRRRRYYLSASRRGFSDPSREGAPVPRRPLEEFLCREDELAPLLPDLRLEEGVARSYRQALHVVQPGDLGAVTACFTSAYGRSPVRSGSYLRLAPGDGGLRRFAPREILRLLGFPEDFHLPPELGLSAAWRLVGNSLSLPPVKVILAELGAIGSAFASAPDPTRPGGRS